MALVSDEILFALVTVDEAKEVASRFLGSVSRGM